MVSNSSTDVTLPTTGTRAALAGTETFTNKTLTSPRVGTSIADTNDLELPQRPQLDHRPGPGAPQGEPL